MSTTQSIAAIVQESLSQAGYGSYFSMATPVITALVGREIELSEKLVDFAVDAGANPREIKTYLREIGMTVDADDEDLESEDDDAIERIEKSIGDLANQVGALTAFARDNGFRG